MCPFMKNKDNYGCDNSPNDEKSALTKSALKTLRHGYLNQQILSSDLWCGNLR